METKESTSRIAGEAATLFPASVAPPASMRVLAGELAGAGVLFAAVFLVLAVFSFDPGDVGLSWPANDPVRNLGGPAGATAAATLYKYFGWSTYALILCIAGAGLGMLFGATGGDWRLRAGGVLLLVVGLATLSQLVQPDAYTSRVTPAVGGLVGYSAKVLLTAACGGVGAFLAATFATLSGVLLASDVAPWRPLLTALDARRVRRARLAVGGDPASAGGLTPAPEVFLSAEERARRRAAELAAARSAAGEPKAGDQAIPAALALAEPMVDTGSGALSPVFIESDDNDAPLSRLRDTPRAGAAEATEPEAKNRDEGDDDDPESADRGSSVVEAGEEDEDISVEAEYREEGEENDGPGEDAEDDADEDEAAAGLEIEATLDDGGINPVDAPAEPSGGRLRPPPLPEPPAIPWELPSPSLLAPAAKAEVAKIEESFAHTAEAIRQTLGHFKVEAEVVGHQRGPVVTMFELQLAPGVPIKRIAAVLDDLALGLKVSKVRLVAPLPGRSTVGLEVPNALRDMVGLRELIEDQSFNAKSYLIPCVLGLDAVGKPVIHDLAKMPHLLVAGTTGSGKSSVVNAILCSILLTRKPDDLKLILIDPKMVELSQYDKAPHLLMPVVTDMEKAAVVLSWAVEEMERRYAVLSLLGVRHVDAFNKLSRHRIEARLAEEGRLDEIDAIDRHMPFIVIVVDEFADLMMVADQDVEQSVIRLAQKSRAVGLHVVLATQRPTVDVITGLIKANMPTRIACRVMSKQDSRTILDTDGAEKLVGMGDVLMLPPGKAETVRAQAAFVPEEEIAALVDHWKEQAPPQYIDLTPDRPAAGAEGGDPLDWRSDDLFLQAADALVKEGRGSASLLQRLCGIGYTRAPGSSTSCAPRASSAPTRAARPARCCSPATNGPPSAPPNTSREPRGVGGRGPGVWGRGRTDIPST
ncbi:MAG: DNA translocase FtsK 4TM domain-containing protein, partial [Planctomycetes bacterium]|nr:DNA translocase FtsK 4TM domain-containing protein [Planctomycetota bacterium]